LERREMKKLVMFLMSVVVGCSPQGEPALTDAERATIEDTILALWDQSLAGIEEVDAAKAYSLFSEKPDVWYIRDGYLYPSIEAAERQYARWFQSYSRQESEIDTLAVTVLSRTAASLFSMGRFFATDTTGVTHPPLELSWSVTWRLEEEGWRIANMHISFPPR
jgi:hypothetical protein